MSFRRIAVIVVVLAGLPFAAAFAAGGVSWGEQYLPPDYPELANYGTDVQCTAVYGYATTGFGMRNGGFVLGMRGPSDGCDWEGGFIGAISGQELKLGPFLLAANLWTGIGGTRRAFDAADGSFALFGQLDVEMGFRVFRGVHVVGYAGMQAIADVLSWDPVAASVSYTPVVGVRLAFGR
jgi:hypothetical protein